MARTFHYGVSCDTEEPVTGVLANNEVCQFLSDEFNDAIDIGWEEAVEEYRAEHDGEDPPDGEFDWWESLGPLLYGDWRKVDGLYEPDKDGKKGFSAIVRECVTQVVWSKTTKRAGMCSPCYPGQADLDCPGDQLAYTLPKDCFDEEIFK